MNIYDFDKTIYKTDSTLDFWFFCIKKNPRLIKYFPRQTYAIFKYILAKLDKTAMKEHFFSFLKDIPNLETYVNDFWRLNAKKIQPWYLEQKKEDDIIISASPEFLLLPLAQNMRIQLIASKVDCKSGKFISPNCYGPEKVTRLHTCIKKPYNIDNFYSDSDSDIPLALISKNAYKVKNGKIYNWTCKGDFRQ